MGLFSFTFLNGNLNSFHQRSTWIQAIKSGPVVNFNRWQDWNGKTLRGVGWYKDEEEEEYEGDLFRTLI